MRGKRAFDVFCAAAALALLWPVMLVIALLVRVSSRGPVIYRGARVGLHGEIFEIRKFRTMWNAPTQQLTTALNDPRITPVGRVLRRYKLDELPQLLNVLDGSMSVVGPRPEMERWVNLYSPQEREILTVRPGITDFASVEFVALDVVVGDSNADDVYLERAFARKNELRLRYVREMSWSTDLRIIASTVRGIVTR